MEITGGTVAVDGGAGADQLELFQSLRSFSVSTDGAGSVTLTNDSVGGAITLSNVETIYSVADDFTYHVAGLLDPIAGSDQDDDLVGTPFHDTFTPGLGSDTITGGRGGDQVLYDGSSSGWSITRQADGSVIVENPLDGSQRDVLVGIEAIFFSDDDFYIYTDSLPGPGASGMRAGPDRAHDSSLDRWSTADDRGALLYDAVPEWSGRWSGEVNGLPHFSHAGIRAPSPLVWDDML